ncbi:hypothetical protein GFM29_33070 [Rhizobium leguminosarum bv. viciae]|nr:hypothetical protein [Rhizobium leguminosarum bv. viciae]
MPWPPPSALPGISPTGGEIGWAHRLPQTINASTFQLRQDAEEVRWARHLPISPPVGEMAGRPEGGARARHKKRPG